MTIPSILRKIQEETQNTIATRKRTLPLTELKSRLRERVHSKRLFAESLTASEELAIIAEIKPASPSAGVLREKVDIAEFAKDYESGGARALSILTEPHFFGGALANLELARKSCSLPLLRKDFIFAPYQLYESRVAGADAVLLIVAMLAPAQLQELLALSKELALDTLVESHTQEELETALSEGGDLLGINTRNLHTFEEDLSLLTLAGETIPKTRPWVAESGLHTRSDVLRAQSHGASAALIGTALMTHPNPRAKLLELRGVQND